MTLPKQFRLIDPIGDSCCATPGNLRQGVCNGTPIDGGWECVICGRFWIGKGKDPYLSGPLETATEFGEKFMEAGNAVIREGKHLCLTNVLGRMALKDLDGTKRLLSKSH